MKTNTIYTADNLAVLRGLNDNSFDLIYLDPPFNSKKTWRAFEGKNVVAEFKDTWSLSDVDVAWHGEIADVNPALYQVIAAAGASGGKGNMSYCIYMAIRLLEMHRILKNTGSLYFHCDQAMAHPIKMLLDAIFGKRNFRSEMIWYRRNKIIDSRKSLWVKMHDNVYFYTKTDDYVFNPLKVGTGVMVTRKKMKKRDGKMISLDEKITYERQQVLTRSLIDIPDINIGASKEKCGYPTQKPLALLERIIKASSNRGDMVLDPFCGCATACVAAQIHGRKWVGIDLSPLAYKLIVRRFEKQYPNLTHPIPVHHSTAIPKRKTAGKRSPKKVIKQKLYGMQQGVCNGCNTLYPFHNFHIDHIEPTSAGGPDIDSNKQLLCGFCNSRKGGRDMKYLLAENRKDGIIK